ncbi:MAG: 30S ribosomal protein S11 [Nanoarchaeota archaeon]
MIKEKTNNTEKEANTEENVEESIEKTGKSKNEGLEIEKAEDADEEKESTEEKAKKSGKEKGNAEAVVNVYTSFNNTIVHVTDMSGKTLAKVTGGMVTKHGRLKANPTIAMFIAKRISEQLKEIGVGNLYFRIRAKTRNPAPGPGANAIIKSLSREGFKVLNILDTTRFPRGGPKKKGGRRGRRP